MRREELDKFINQILDQKKLPNLSEEVRAQLVSDMGERLIDQVDRAIINALPEDKIDELNNLIESGADEPTLQKYIAESGVDIKDITIKTMLLFRDLYIEAPKQ